MFSPGLLEMEQASHMLCTVPLKLMCHLVHQPLFKISRVRSCANLPLGAIYDCRKHMPIECLVLVCHESIQDRNERRCLIMVHHNNQTLVKGARNAVEGGVDKKFQLTVLQQGDQCRIPEDHRTHVRRVIRVWPDTRSVKVIAVVVFVNIHRI